MAEQQVELTLPQNVIVTKLVIEIQNGFL